MKYLEISDRECTLKTCELGIDLLHIGGRELSWLRFCLKLLSGNQMVEIVKSSHAFCCVFTRMLSPKGRCKDCFG